MLGVDASVKTERSVALDTLRNMDTEPPVLLICGTTAELSAENEDVVRSLASVLRTPYYHKYIVVGVATSVGDMISEMITGNKPQIKLQKLTHPQIVALCCNSLDTLPSKSVVVSVWFSDEEDFAETISACCLYREIGCVTLVLPSPA